MAKLSRKQGDHHKLTIFGIVLLFFLIVYCISLFIPLIWGLLTSLKTPIDFLDNSVGLPSKWMFSNFITAFENFKVSIDTPSGMRYVYLIEMFGYGLLYSVGCALTSMLCMCVTAYLTSRFPYFFSKVVYTVVIVTMIIPIVGALPSELQMSRLIGAYDNMFGMWVTKASFLGMYFLVFHATFKNIPHDYEEAASIDGAGNLRIMFQIMLPLVTPVIFVVFLLKFIEFWNDYQVPMIFLPSMPTVALGMYRFNFSASAMVSSAPMKMTGGMLLLLPILILFLIFRNKMIGNISIGGIKG